MVTINWIQLYPFPANFLSNQTSCTNRSFRLDYSMRRLMVEHDVKMVMKELKRFFVVSLTYAFVYVAAVLISIFLYSWMVYRWFKGSPGLFSVKRRELPPACLNDPEYGEHCYIQIKVSRMNAISMSSSCRHQGSEFSELKVTGGHPP